MAWRAVTILSLGVILSVADAAAQQACVLSEPEPARATAALDGETLMLTDGRELRLIGAKPVPPLRSREGEKPQASLAKTAREALDAMVSGQALELRYGGERKDRHGRVLAHAFVVRGQERIWLQGALVEQGHARVYSFSDNHACAGELLAREARARKRGLGLWRVGAFRIRSADETGELLRLRQSYQIVEGKVLAVGETRSRTYLNFGDDWRKDFTVSISRRAGKALIEAGLNPAKLKHARIRVRGWIEPRNGPSIEVTHAAQIEILQTAPKENPAVAGPPGSRDI